MNTLKICTTLRSEKRQQQFQNTLLNLMAVQQFPTITVIALCKEAAVSRKTFYQYYHSIEEVLYQVIDREIENSCLYLEITPDIKSFLLFWEERKWLLDILKQNEMSYLLIDRFNTNYLKQNVEFSSQFIKYAGCGSAVFTVLILWHREGMVQTIEEVEQMIIDILSGDLKK